MKATVFTIVRMILTSFILVLMALTLEADNAMHVILSLPIFLGVLYIGIEGMPKSNKQNKEK